MHGDRAYFGTGANTGKAKRLRNFPDVDIAPCTVRGRPTGPSLRARARRLDGEEAAAALGHLTRKNPIVFRIFVPLELRLKRTHGVFYELSDFKRPLPDCPHFGHDVR